MKFNGVVVNFQCVSFQRDTFELEYGVGWRTRGSLKREKLIRTGSIDATTVAVNSTEELAIHRETGVVW